MHLGVQTDNTAVCTAVTIYFSPIFVSAIKRHIIQMFRIHSVFKMLLLLLHACILLCTNVYYVFILYKYVIHILFQ